MKVRIALSAWVGIMLVAACVKPAIGNEKQKPDCNRQCLTKILDTYFDSVTKHMPSELSVASNVRFTENAVERKFGEGLWQSGGPATYRLDAIDPEDGQAASSALITDNGKDAILLVRLKVEKKKVTEVETLVVRPGEGQRSDPDNLLKLPNPYKNVVPESDRSNREQLINAAGAYLDALGRRGTAGYAAPPFAPEAFRVENGVQVTGIARNGRAPVSLVDSFKNPPPRTAAGVISWITDRRYPVIDLEHGTILAIGQMNLRLPAGGTDGPPGHAIASQYGLRIQILSEFFKVVGGQIQQIQAVMYDLDDPKVTSPGWLQ